jgi:hypothetical protein
MTQQHFNRAYELSLAHPSARHTSHDIINWFVCQNSKVPSVQKNTNC